MVNTLAKQAQRQLAAALTRYMIDGGFSEWAASASCLLNALTRAMAFSITGRCEGLVSRSVRVVLSSCVTCGGGFEQPESAMCQEDGCCQQYVSEETAVLQGGERLGVLQQFATLERGRQRPDGH